MRHGGDGRAEGVCVWGWARLTCRVRSSEMREMLILWRPMTGVCGCAGELAGQSSHSVQWEKKQRVLPVQMETKEMKRKRKKKKRKGTENKNGHNTGGRKRKKKGGKREQLHPFLCRCWHRR